MTRVFYREPVDSARRIGQQSLLHIIREDHPTFPGEAAHCNLRIVNESRMPTTVIDTMPMFLGEGLRWCPMCVGKLAHEREMLDRLAQLLAIPAADLGYDGDAVELMVAQLRACQQPAAADMLEVLAGRLAEQAREAGKRIAAAIRARAADPLGAGAMVAWHAFEEAAQIAEADCGDPP